VSNHPRHPVFAPSRQREKRIALRGGNCGGAPGRLVKPESIRAFSRNQVRGRVSEAALQHQHED
jgi:hypothetical protein